jgi:phosphatidylserine/phosphatidylglycerophosphate/cardiolipin synthase-like enzyme
VTLRQARPSAIAHNKFMVRVAGGTRPVEVWTGSTNLSLGGIHGQTNVGHWVRDAATAELFARYWRLLLDDPGGRKTDPPAEKARRNGEFTADVRALCPMPADLSQVPAGVSTTFSPQPDGTMLTAYAELLDSATDQASVTLAFGISAVFKNVLKDNTASDPLVFMLLEKKDAPSPRSRTPFVRINAANNVYQAWGAHSKFMLVDPLGADPIVISGSANFSAASTVDNDENMLIIRGSQRVADLYHTEFNRLFNHYYFRSALEQLHRGRGQTDQPSLFLDETPGWQAKYAPGTFRAKRLALYATMSGFNRS